MTDDFDYTDEVVSFMHDLADLIEQNPEAVEELTLAHANGWHYLESSRLYTPNGVYQITRIGDSV